MPRISKAQAVALKTEIQLATLAVDAWGESLAEASHQIRLFSDAMRTANAVSGGKPFAALRAEPEL